MRFLPQAVVLFTATAWTFIIPPDKPLVHQIDDSHAAAESTVTDATTVYFSIPCIGCFDDPKDELNLGLEIYPSDQPCEFSALILNGAGIVHTPSTILFTANTSRGSHVKGVLADIETTCLDGQVTLLNVRVQEILDGCRPQNVGFTASLQQSSSPAVLRIESGPLVDIAGTTSSLQQKWTLPQDHPYFVVVGPTRMMDHDLPDEFQKELRRLHEIKAHIGRLVHAHQQQEHRIYEIIKDDFDICHGATCYVQTAIRKAPEIFELLKAHFKHKPDVTKLHGFRDAQNLQEIALSMDDDVPDDVPPFPGRERPDHPSPHHRPGDHDAPLPTPKDHERLHHPHPPPPGHDGEHPPPPPGHHGGHPPPPPGHHGEHPPTPPEHEGDRPHPPPPPPHHDGSDHRRPGHGCHHRGLHAKSHDPPLKGHHCGPSHRPLLISLGTFVFFAITAALLFKLIRSRTDFFSRYNHKRQRDHATRREECRNRAAFRRAALRHKWTQWWSQFRQPESIAGYEEKRARLLGQEDALEDVMQSEIRDLRRAHEIVGDMMRAEEGRQRLYHEVNFGSAPSSPSQPYHRDMQQQQQSTEAPLPLYQANIPPPSYDAELEGDMMVVDGFSYTPGGSDATPDSSVVDCESRMSFETHTTSFKA